MSLKEKINKDEVPSHIAIIMDGNGRWAKKRGYVRIKGHSKGVDAVRETVEAAVELGVKYLTLYAFSTENWRRSPDEVKFLMGFQRILLITFPHPFHPAKTLLFPFSR